MPLFQQHKVGLCSRGSTYNLQYHRSPTEDLPTVVTLDIIVITVIQKLNSY